MDQRAARFVGRDRQIALLTRDLADVRSSGQGRFVLLRGRRRVGKSRLVSEFLLQADVPSVFFAATSAPDVREMARFADAVARSSLPAADLVRAGTAFSSWEAALSTIALTGNGHASVVVIDELPYLVDGRPDVEAQLQHVWDQVLERHPVLLIAIGSDLAMMASLTSYGRPLFGRPTREIVLDPLTVAEVGDLLDLPATEAIDASLVVGGFPLVARSWAAGADQRTFLTEALADPTSPLIVTGERLLAAEFPEPGSRAALTAIGSGESGFTSIGQQAGLPATTLRRTLDTLTSKRAIVAERPLSTRPARLSRLRIADPYLRFWLRFVEPGIEEIERGRSDLVLARIDEGWTTYRGTAVEPLVRESLCRLLPAERFGDTRTIGSYWSRSFDVEVDVVGAGGKPDRVSLVGSVKWRDRAEFTRADLTALLRAREAVPGTDEHTLLLAVSRTPVVADGLDIVLGANDLVDAWR